MSKSNQLRKAAYKILEDNRNIPWVGMLGIDRAENYLRQAQKLERKYVKSNTNK